MDDVEVLAHRGSRERGATENSIAAITAATELGATGVEVDLRVTADGVVVLHHDPRLRSAAGDGLFVGEHGWAELSEAAARTGSGVCRFSDALTALSRCPRAVLELKAPPAGTEPGDAVHRGLAGAVAEASAVLASTALTVSSFDPRLLDGVRALAGPTAVRWALISQGRPAPDAARDARRWGFDEVHLALSDVRGPLDPDGRRGGPAFVVWVVDTVVAARSCLRAGVSTVMSDHPGRLVAELGGIGGPAVAASAGGTLINR